MRFPRPTREGLLPWKKAGVAPPHKLTDAEVVAIREEARDGDRSFSAIGARYGVVGQTVARLARGALRRGADGPIETRDYAPPRRAVFGGAP